jgi:hypothetical protein
MPGTKTGKKQGGMSLSAILVPTTLTALTAALQSTKKKKGGSACYKGGMQWAGGIGSAPLGTAFSAPLKGGAAKKKKKKAAGKKKATGKKK